MTAAGYYADEICNHRQSFYEMAQSRVTFGSLRLRIGTTNPDSPSHFLVTRFLDNPEVDVKHHVFVFEDNPSLTPEIIKELRNSFSGIQYDRLIRGLWCQSEGAIFDSWSRIEHTVNEIPLKSIKFYMIGGDWGYSEGHDLALLLIAVEDDGTCYVVDELVRSKQLVDQSLVNLMKMKGWFSLPLVSVIVSGA
jgi:PBSX family phage terminase large subunit